LRREGRGPDEGLNPTIEKIILLFRPKEPVFLNETILEGKKRRPAQKSSWGRENVYSSLSAKEGGISLFSRRKRGAAIIFQGEEGGINENTTPLLFNIFQ